MSKINIRPTGESLEITKDQTLLDCLRENNVYVKSSCGGVASCSDCIIKIVSGEDNLTSPPFEEIQLLGNVFHITKERLACQCKVAEGDVTIDLSDHDKSRDEKRLKNKTTSFSSKTRVRKKEELDAKEAAQAEAKANEESSETPTLPANQREREGGKKRPRPFKTED